MKQCVLIATLPSLSNPRNVEAVFASPFVSEVRFNTGTSVPYSAEETLSLLKGLSMQYQKKLWIDLKGRQLRVTKWADPLYSCIEINHKVQVLYPATVIFRGGDKVNLMHVKKGNQLYVDPLPKQALGAGQSVNIIAREVEIEGYLTEKDKAYLSACQKLDLPYIMASFVEEPNDLTQIREILPNSQIVSKIESLKGLEFIRQHKGEHLMAARDDLYLQTGQSYRMLKNLQEIIANDPEAICASKIFLSLEKRESADLADFADLELMYQLGYRKFMLCDNVCNYCFERAMKAWKEFIYG